MKNIIVYALTDRRGGIESFFLNYKKHLKNVHLDFIKITPKALPYEAELDDSDIYYVPMSKNNPILRHSNIKKALTAKKYDALWFNSNDLASVDIIKEAKKLNMKCIVHAHNSKTDKFNRTVRHNINKLIINKDLDGKFACSISAAKWFYPDYKKATIIYNAIDVNKFLFDINARKIVRDKYNIPADFMVLGDVGRLEKQKNISYLIDIFSQYHKKNPKSYLMIIGNGSDKDELKKYVVEKRLNDEVIFTGEVSDTSQYLSALDIFVMPSLYEGLPVTLVEAQASGLDCLVADNITQEVNITKNIKYYPIKQKNIDLWVKNVTKSNNRINKGKKLFNTVFDISKSANNLEKSILKLLK